MFVVVLSMLLRVLVVGSKFSVVHVRWYTAVSFLHMTCTHEYASTYAILASIDVSATQTVLASQSVRSDKIRTPC